MIILKLIILSHDEHSFHQNEFKDPIPRADFSVKRNSKYAVAVVLLRHGFIFALHVRKACVAPLLFSGYVSCIRFLRPIPEFKFTMFDFIIISF